MNILSEPSIACTFETTLSAMLNYEKYTSNFLIVLDC